MYDSCAVCGLKGDSDTKKKKKRKTFIQGEINEYNHDKGQNVQKTIVCSKNTNCFSLILVVPEIYRFKIVHFLLIFGL